MCVLQEATEWKVYLSLLYADDMLVASKSKSAIDKLKKQFSEFEMKDLSEAKKVLGTEIERDRKSSKVCLTQKGI